VELSLATDLRYRVREEAARLGLVDSPVLAAVSGGSDSVACLLLLQEAVEALGIDLAVVHVVHPVRGRAAEEDAEWVGNLAEERGLCCFIEPIKLPEGRPASEAVLRKARYEAFERVAESHGDALVALGHTADDNAETVLLNVLRGTGPTGISGIPERRGRHVRPLLGERRHILRAFLEVGGHTWREDLTNRSSLSRRGRVRHMLLPLLAREYNPRIVEALCRTAAIVREEDSLLEQQAARVLNRSRHSSVNGRVVLDCTVLSDQPAPLLRRALRLAVREVLGPAASVGWIRAESLRTLTATEGIAREEPMPGLLVERRADRLTLWTPRRTDPSANEATLPIPGESALPDLGVVVRADVISRNLLREPVESLPKDVLVMPRKGLPDRLALRRWRSGDRIRPFGMEGTKTVADLLSDMKVPMERRERTAVLCAGDEVLWVVGLRTADGRRVDEKTGLVVRVVAEVEY
jgi:tRNA(Ile)-lysidine synthase